MLFINTGQLENKLEAKLKKQEIVFDTAVFHFELTYDNKGFVEFTKAREARSLSVTFSNQNGFIICIPLGKNLPCQFVLAYSLRCFHSVSSLRLVQCP